MATTLPRPSRPSLSPPGGPLPALPVPKTRDNAATSTPTSPATNSPPTPIAPSSQLRAPASLRASSAYTAKPPQKESAGASTHLPTLSTSSIPSGIATPARTLRKTISIGAFPQPPKGVAQAARHPPSPLSTSSTPGSSTMMDRKIPTPGTQAGVPKRGSSLKRNSSKNSVASIRSVSMKTPVIGTPSLLNGSADGQSVAIQNTGLLNIPSPPQSRNSSAQGSYATSATTFEDIDEDIRGRDAAPKAAADKSSDSKDGKGNVLVSVRVRPDTAAEAAKSELEWMVDGRRSLISYKGREGGEYIYDNVFTTHDNNARVYDSAAKRLVRRVMEGYHGTVFAYGMTGTGKTFSMQGTATSPGVIPLAITDIFSYIRETPHREFLLRVSYLEIYNEKIHDLLSAPVASGLPGQPAQEEIKLREDAKRGVYATPLKEEIVQSPTQLLRVIARGDGARRVAGTQFNARSSRSHAVVQIVVESRERNAAIGSLADSKKAAATPGGVRVSTLSLIDLAGSEKAAESKERRTEGAHINKSLLTLGTVIARLSGDKDEKERDVKKNEKKDGPKAADKDKHLPYRDSKLTRLLQGALSGNSLVSILCTIQIGAAGSAASANSHTAETLSTLKFASRAKNNIVSHAKKAEEALGSGADAGSRALLDRYRIEIQQLRKELEEAQKSTTTASLDTPKPEVDEEEEKAKELEAEQRHEEQMLEMQLARTALKERIEHLNRLILSSKSIGVNNANRSFSVLSYRNRGSVVSQAESRPRSGRSSTGSRGLEVPALKKTSSGTFISPNGSPNANGTVGETGSEEDDSLGENGDGTATAAVQISALQSDLADKNRYISTLEKRLLQARRSSHSRVSMSLQRVTNGEEGGLEQALKERDAEIADLRARLDDKDKMITALRSAARQREAAVDLNVDTSMNSSPTRRRTSGSGHYRSPGGSNASGTVSFKRTSPLRNTPPLSPVGLGIIPAKTEKPREKGVEEMTRILDEMITETAAGGRTPLLRRGGNTLRAVSETHAL